MGVVQDAVKQGLFKQGDQGEAVKTIQLALRNLGYPLTGTGYFGGATDTAVTAFQRKRGLTADGVVGPVTARELDTAQAVPVVEPEDVRPLWLTYGLTQIGTREFPGSRDNRTILDWARDEGGNIASSYTHDSIPWCALWANHILTKNGIKGTETLWALDFAGRWPSIQLGGPAVGAFAPMLRNGGGHITVVVGRDQHGNIMGLGGNQHDEVNVTPFAMSRLNKGFWWPALSVPPARVGFTNLPIVRSDGRISSNES